MNKLYHFIYTPALLLTASLMLSGCLAKPILLDKVLDKQIKVTRIKKQQTETGFLKVSAIIVNKTRAQVQVSIRTRFTNRRGQIIESTGWTSMFIDGGSFSDYSTNATSKEAKKFLIEIRSGM